ncbi:FAD-dependent oxidoreductase [Marivirga lumbricoides]|uniref:NADH:ubiquinone reductase (non-electrogenic) n=1 Tax=Marivirga lumbricoides TaxID=1046115 RepID=A0A2T4DSD5_9BACT|nr:FAD-dependent oxidoreductase [Marivirga lumbricoides]
MEVNDILKIPKSDNPRIVIIGGGFAGIQMAKMLDKKPVQVVLFDRHNYHTFQPLLYQVATAGLEPDAIAGPLRKIIEKSRNVHFRMAMVNEINTYENTVYTEKGNLQYDYLVIAAGSKTNYFGNYENLKKAFPLKQVPQALDLRSHILQNFEQAVLTSDEEQLNKLLNIVIVGGGPTGVELAGAIGELKKHVMPHDYPELDLSKMNIYLAEGLDRLLAGMSEFADKKAQQYLKKFDVQVKLGSMVTEFDGETVTFKNGEKLTSSTLIWAAGVRGNLIKGMPETSIEKSMYIVDEFNKVINTENIYAVGDNAFMKSDKRPKGYPMLAPVAMQQGENLANNILRKINNKKLKPFKYTNRGTMATIGRNRAIAELPNKIRFGGFFAWIAWMFVHLIQIVGFRSKIVILANWIWNYFTYDRGTRLIIRPYTPPKVEDLKKEEETDR